MKIRKLNKKDAISLKKLFLNEKSLKDTGVNVTKNKITLNFVEEWLKERIEQYNLKKPKFIVYAIINNEDKIVGTIGIGEVNYKSKSGFIGYWVSKTYSGKGYCTVAIKKFIEKITRLVNIKKYFAKVSRTNIASSKVLLKNKFKIIKESKKNLLLEKEIHQGGER